MTDSNVVKIKRQRTKPGQRLNLRGNNRVAELLATYEAQAAVLADAKRRKDEAAAELKAILGDAEAAIADGFTLSFKAFERAEFVVPACTIRPLKVFRQGRRGML